MIYLGQIVHLQVQEFSLKVGEGVNQRYDRAGLHVVDELELSDGGVRGFHKGIEVADVHHRDHPLTKIRGSENSISFGFSGHYDLMRERFGSHFDPAVAGENILIEHGGRVDLTDVEKGLVIQSAGGRSLHLSEVLVAAPCAPFTRWAMQFPEGAKPDRTVTNGLQFLNDGMRGYYCRYAGEPARVQVGDSVFAVA